MLTDLIVVEPKSHSILRRVWCDYVERMYRMPNVVGDEASQRATIRQLDELGHQIGLSFWLFVKKNATPDEHAALKAIAGGTYNAT